VGLGMDLQLCLIGVDDLFAAVGTLVRVSLLNKYTSNAHKSLPILKVSLSAVEITYDRCWLRCLDGKSICLDCDTSSSSLRLLVIALNLCWLSVTRKQKEPYLHTLAFLEIGIFVVEVGILWREVGLEGFGGEVRLAEKKKGSRGRKPPQLSEI